MWTGGWQVLDPAVITPTERAGNPDFFPSGASGGDEDGSGGAGTDEDAAAAGARGRGGGARTPARYLRLRNALIALWHASRPAYLSKTAARRGLVAMTAAAAAAATAATKADAIAATPAAPPAAARWGGSAAGWGDVNVVGRVHAFLERIGAINVGATMLPAAVAAAAAAAATAAGGGVGSRTRTVPASADSDGDRAPVPASLLRSAHARTEHWHQRETHAKAPHAHTTAHVHVRTFCPTRSPRSHMGEWGVSVYA
jgi:hypothetical protein